MSPAHGCCCEDGDCCEAASRSWSNKYCISVGEMFFSFDRCVSCCEEAQVNCGDDCNDALAYCCTTTIFNWCVTGAIFRIPRTLDSDQTCQPEDPDATYSDSLCPATWSNPDWAATEGGENSYYASPTNGGLKCTVAPNWARVRYRCRHALMPMAGYEDGEHCGCYCDDVGEELDDFDDTYTVEGMAELFCVADACTEFADISYDPLVCDCEDVSWQAPMHVLRIKPIEDPVAGLIKPPTMWFGAKLSLSDTPGTASWTLLRVGNFGPVSNRHCYGVNDVDPCDPDAGNEYDPATCNQEGQGCAGYGSGDILNLAGALTVSGGSCSENLCTVT